MTRKPWFSAANFMCMSRHLRAIDRGDGAAVALFQRLYRN
jgi:hypothetical protein